MPYVSPFKSNTGSTGPTPSGIGYVSPFKNSVFTQENAVKQQAYKVQQSKLDALTQTIRSGDYSKIANALSAARAEGLIDQKQQIDIWKQLETGNQASLQSQLKGIYSLKNIASTVGETALDMGKGIVSGVQQGAGAVADTALQASGVLGEIKRSLDFTKTKEQKDLERLLTVDTTEGLRKWINQQKDASGESIKGTSNVDVAANNIRLGRGSAEDFKKVGLAGLNVGANATMFVNPVASLSKTIPRTIAKNALNNAIIGAIGGGAEAGTNDRNILTGALQGAIAAATLSGVGDIIGKSRGASQLADAVNKARVGDDIMPDVTPTKVGELMPEKPVEVSQMAQTGTLSDLEKAASMEVPTMGPKTMAETVGDNELTLAIGQSQKSIRAEQKAADMQRALENVAKKTDIGNDVENMVDALKVKNSGTLDTLNNIKGVKRATRILETQNNVTRSFGEAGQEFSARIDTQEILKDQYKGQVERLINRIRSSSPDYKAKLQTAIDDIKMAKTPEARANLKGIAKEIADIQDLRRDQFIAQGLDIGKQEGYFTSMIKPGKELEARIWLRNNLTEKLNKAVREGNTNVLDNFGLTTKATAQEIRDAAMKEVDGNITSLSIQRNMANQIKAGIEYTKTDILPKEFYETDPEIILANWSDETAKRLAGAQVFGKNDELADTLLRRIGDEYGDDAQKYVNTMLERQRYGAPTSAITPILKNVRSYQMLSKMGLSSITNAGQVANKITVFGPTKTLGAYVDVIRNWNKYLDEAAARGIGLSDITDSLMENVYAGGKKSKLTSLAGGLLDINGFKKIETMHRLADIKLADDLMDNFAKKGFDSKYTRNWLDKFGINADSFIKNGASKANKDVLTRQVVGAIDFYVDPKDIAKWTTSGELGKTISQLGKFGMKQGGFVAKQIIGEAKKGNFIPALRWLVGSQVVGAGVIGAKGLITGKERENSISDTWNSLADTLDRLSTGDFKGAWEQSAEARQYAEENMARAGGLGYAYDVVSGLDYGNTWLEKVVGLLGPTASDAKSLTESIDAFVSGDIEKGARKASKLIPFGNVAGPLYDRVTGGNTFTFNPKGSAVYDLTDSLGDESFTVSRSDADAFGRAVGTDKISQTAVVETIARKLYDKDGEATTMAGEYRDKLNQFLDKYGVTNAKQIAEESYQRSADKSEALRDARMDLSDEEKEITSYYSTGSKADAYLKSKGSSLDKHPDLKNYYNIRAK